MPTLATWAPEDGVLGAVAPLALASTQPTALVVDLDAMGPAYPSDRTLLDLVEGSPRAAELIPKRVGLAVLRNGGIAYEDAKSVVDLLLANWPAVVLRLPPWAPDDVPAPLVPVRLLVPGRLFPPPGRGVYQRLAGSTRRAKVGASHILPPAPRRHVGALLEGRDPGPSRWLRSWSRVWGAGW